MSLRRSKFVKYFFYCWNRKKTSVRFIAILKKNRNAAVEIVKRHEHEMVPIIRKAGWNFVQLLLLFDIFL